MFGQSVRRTWLLTGVAGVLAAFLLLFRLAGGPDSDTPDPAQPAPGPNGLQWRAGQAQQYQVDIRSSFEMTFPGVNAPQAMNVHMDGTLDFRTLSTTATGANTGWRFESLSLTIDGATDASVNRALESPFRVRFEQGGRPQVFEFPASLPQEHREILENLVRMFQVVVTEGAAWEVEETNATGRYSASYVRSAPGRISKRKGSYLPSVSGAAVPEVTSEESVLLNPAHDWITQMTLTERIMINDAGSPPVQISNRARIELVGTRVQAAPVDWGFVASAEPPEPEVKLPTLSPDEAQRRLQSYVQELDEAEEGRPQIIHRVRDLLLADDQLPALLLETLRTEQLNDLTRADLYLAFELAGTPAAQAALSSVLAGNGWPAMDAMRAIVALGGVSEPTDDTLATLWDLARSNLDETDRRDLPGTAALAIGSLGDTLRQSDKPDYFALRADLLVSASGAIEPAERAVFLYALGNTADPDPVLKRDLVSYLDDPSAEVRSAAAKTLGRLGTGQVEDELLTRAQQESSGQARASMVEALASWDEPSADAMRWAQSAVQQEVDEQARYNMAVLLGKNMDAFPDNRLVLQALLESEQSKRIRQKVANMLY